MDNQSNLEPKIVPTIETSNSPSNVVEGNMGNNVEAPKPPEVAKPSELPSIIPTTPTTNEANYVGFKEEEALLGQTNPLLNEKGFIATPTSLKNTVNSNQTTADDLLRFLSKETPVKNNLSDK